MDAFTRLRELDAALAAAGEASTHPRELEGFIAFQEAVAILSSADVPLAVVFENMTGSNWVRNAAALAALCQRPDRDDAASSVQRYFAHLNIWPVYYALGFFITITKRPPVGAAALPCGEYWADYPLVPAMYAEYFAARAALGDTPTFGTALSRATQAGAATAQKLHEKVDHPFAAALLSEIASWRASALDRTFLETCGRFLDARRDTKFLIEHHGIAELLATAESAILRAPFRSVLVVGEPRSGKTTFLNLLARRANEAGWAVFEAGATELMAGQKYIGELEGQVQRVMAEVAAVKRVIWYVPDFTQIARSGTHKGRAATLLDQMLPSIASGRIVVISETTPAALSALLQTRPVVRTAFELVRIQPMSEADADALIGLFAVELWAKSHCVVDDDAVDAATHLARHYLGNAQMPGAAIDLLKLAANRLAATGDRRITRGDVLTTLSQVSGMPALVLDDRERLDLAGLRRFFSSRVIGQPEAVDVIVDRIAMLKAGLTDPSRPTGVFLFAGPTGTGKTELAKTLATFLFGSPERLIRLDMSEFQSADSLRKIIGDPDESADTQSLTQRVRKHPFSVVLLDEFEKAHPQVWDLFLQVFDDGRLTDAAGQTVDLRHCIIILTSNLGAAVPQAGLGFVSQPGAFSQEHVVRAVHQSFRPEFVNRLDAIIVFRPLTRDLMRNILSKELALVLERRGLRHREWAVEWESSALEFLLDKGFSHTMGARPLKRAIDRYLLAPLAATMVEHRFPEGDQFLFVRSDGRAIQVEFVDPDAPLETAAPVAGDSAAPSLARMMLQPSGSTAERAALASVLQRIETDFVDPSWTALEESLTTEMREPDFWSHEKRFGVLARYALIDRIRAATGTARGLEARLDRARGREDRYSKDLVARLATQLKGIELGMEDARTNVPVEVVISLAPVLESANESAQTPGWCAQLMKMYQRWAARRLMLWEELPSGTAGVSQAIVSGFGASRILGREAGLHILEYGSAKEPSRAVARVTVAATPGVEPDNPAQRTASMQAELRRAGVPSSIVRRYRLEVAPLVRDATGWRTGRVELVMDGHFDLLHEVLTLPIDRPAR